MFIKYFLVVLVLNGVLSDGPDECVRYYFEDYDVLFPKDKPAMCSSLPILWNLGSYDNSTVAAPNEMSKWFIKPTPSDSYVCTPSFLFTMMPDYLIEANVYLETTGSDGLVLDAIQLTEAGSHRILVRASVYIARGWRVLRVTTDSAAFVGNPPFQGYIRFLGRASENSVMMIDSFRYVPSSMNPETECVLYEDYTTSLTTTTTIPTTTITPTIPFATTTVSTPIITVHPTTSTTIASITPTTTTPITIPTTTSEIYPDMTPTTTPTTPITTTPKNVNNYFVKELVYFRKSIRYSKKRTKVVNLNGVEQPFLDLSRLA